MINVGANFAHVSPCFEYSMVEESDQYCDIVDLGTDIATSYLLQTIIQSYKVVFSMQILGDPSKYASQVKTGVKDLFTKTREWRVVSTAKTPNSFVTFVESLFQGMR